MTHKPVLCLDFDGVLHSYREGWRNGVIYDPPTPGAGLALLRYVCDYRVAVYSFRSKSIRGRWAMKTFVRQMLWDACLTDTALSEAAWQATQGKPPEYIPWTAYDVRDVADHIGKAISWPWFKPSALLTIDDRALTFTGNWDDFTPEKLRAFKPWMKGGNVTGRHWSAPQGLNCADCTMDGEACPECYAAWWKHRHPNVTFVGGVHV